MDVSPWILRYEDLDLIDPIGKGSYACVHRANWGGTVVAVKVFKDRDLEKENLLLTLSNPVPGNLRNVSEGREGWMGGGSGAAAAALALCCSSCAPSK